MIKCFLTTLFLCFAATVCFAQIGTLNNRHTDSALLGTRHSRIEPDTSSDNTYVIMLTMPIEFPIADTKALDRLLGDVGLPDTRLPFAALGIGYQLEIDQFMAFVSYNRSTAVRTTDSTKTKVSYRSVSLGLGYDVIHNPHYSLYGYGGLKFCKTKYAYSQVVDSVTLTGYLGKNLDHKEIAHARTTVDLGLGFSYQTFFLVGVRAGVLLPFGSPTWRIDNTKVQLDNAPNINYQGYVMLTLGIGNSSSGREDRRAAAERRLRGESRRR